MPPLSLWILSLVTFVLVQVVLPFSTHKTQSLISRFKSVLFPSSIVYQTLIGSKYSKQGLAMSLQTDPLFIGMQQYINDDLNRAQGIARDIGANLVFEIAEKDGTVLKQWLLSFMPDAVPAIILVNDKQQIESVSVNSTLIADDKNVFALLRGKLNPEYAYLTGALKIVGRRTPALKVKNLISISKTLPL